ncbi:hypothetical protein [Nitrobacter sp. Nb-311A]|uniref:hypothetical protein n=1 Tax=Nitrobacter sp. Nb-311A TaxID=314253 RepID=UPI0013EFB4F1|nr:hypothetical protein [Nitrobacter sp. Nb-311A]
MRDLPELLRIWRKSYKGEIDLLGYPEGFIGDLRGEKKEPRLVVLGLNPGVAHHELQGPEGEWTRVIRRLSYSRSLQERTPFQNPAWRKYHGKDSRYWVNLVRFAKRWLGDQAGLTDVLNFEMFPFHSKNLKHAITPPSDIIEAFVWSPLKEMETDTIFAFGRDWVSVCDKLLGQPLACFGRNALFLGDETNGNWQVRIYPLEHKRVVVSWQNGYAGPPSRNVEELRRVLHETA